jgi:Flp pilus assembly protein TadG
MAASQRGQAVVEAALVLPVLLLLLFGLVGVEEVLRAEAGVQATAHDAARAAALAGGATQAAQAGVAAGLATAATYRLDAGALALTVDAQDFGPGGRVSAQARYVVRLSDLPLLGGLDVSLASSNVQPVDRYRAFPGGAP